MDIHYHEGVGTELKEDIESRVIAHRNEHYGIMSDKTFRGIITSIGYKNFKIQVDPYRLEHLLRIGYDVCIGKNKVDNIVILGYSAHANPQIESTDKIYSKEDIKFCIPKTMQLDKYKIIDHSDDCKTGNFIVVTNQSYYHFSDEQIIRHYCWRLAEIEGTRYSLSCQAKSITWYRGERGDETMNQMIEKSLNGAPFVHISDKFDIENSFGSFENAGTIPSLLVACKDDYNSVYSQMMQALGINSLGTIKQSGVSPEESNANNQAILEMENLYVKQRKSDFDKLNKRFDLDIQPYIEKSSVVDLLGGVDNEQLHDNNTGLRKDGTTEEKL